MKGALLQAGPPWAVMVISEDPPQLVIAAKLESVARSLAHNSRSVPAPTDSYGLLGSCTLPLSTWRKSVTS